MVGISQVFASRSWSIFGRLAVDADDGQVGAVDGAAHVQAAGHGDAQLGRQGHRSRSSGCSSSMIALTSAEASVAALWQWIQPWVWTMLLMELPVPPTGQPVGLQLGDQRLDLRLVGDQELDVVAAGEAQVAVAVLVGDVADLADGVDAHQAGRADAHRVDGVAGLGDVLEHARPQGLVVLPLAVVLDRSPDGIISLK